MIIGSAHMQLFCVDRLTKKQVLLFASFRVIYVTLVVIQTSGDIFLIHSKAAWCSNAPLSGLSHRQQVKTGTSVTLVFFSEDIVRTVHIYFSSANKMSSPNEQQKH
jgi:hypothetical protein